MAWLVWADGTVTVIGQQQLALAVENKLGSELTQAQYSASLARGSATLSRIPINARLSAVTTANLDPTDIAGGAFGPASNPAESNGAAEMANGAGPGDDLRDITEFRVDESGQLIVTDTGEAAGAAEGFAGAIVAVGGATAARSILRVIMGNVTRITAGHWAALPGWARTALGAIGLGVGIDLALNVPGIPGDSIILGGDGDGAHMPTHLQDGHLGAHIVGSWNANGVTFYRLSDGKLAVQNKKGRWKVWRPKRPVVLMPGGANNLRTLLKADKILNQQAKAIAKMLNRRAPRARKASSSEPKHVTILQSDGKSVNY